MYPGREASGVAETPFTKSGKMPTITGTVSASRIYVQTDPGGELKQYYEIDPKNSWMIAAPKRICRWWCPAGKIARWEIFLLRTASRELQPTTVREVLNIYLSRRWYTRNPAKGVGFFQIGGGIAGVSDLRVPMLHQDLEREGIPFWKLLLPDQRLHHQLRSYSGAVRMRNHLGKLSRYAKYIIESDATIVAPLMFAYILDM